MTRKSEADVTSRLQQEVTPMLHYKYPFKNTHRDVDNSLNPSPKTLILKDEAIRGGFSQIPNVVLRDPKLSGNEVRLYSLLLSYAWQERECFPGQDTLAQDMGLTRKSVNQLLHKLRAHKLISWKRQGLGKSNIYFIERIATAYSGIFDNKPMGNS